MPFLSPACHADEYHPAFHESYKGTETADREAFARKTMVFGTAIIYSFFEKAICLQKFPPRAEVKS